MAAPEAMDDDIRKFEEIGTHPAANHNAIAEALVFHHGIGVERKAARLRYLRDRWMRRLAGEPRFIFTSFDPAMACGIGTVGIEGIDTGPRRLCATNADLRGPSCTRNSGPPGHAERLHHPRRDRPPSPRRWNR